MKISTRSILQELNQVASVRNTDAVIESRATNIINSAINLIESMKKQYDPEVADVPDVPVVPDDPLEPAEPDVPDVPLVADDPDVPVVPLEPDDPLEPAEPDDPVEPSTPLVPEDPLDPAEPLEPVFPLEPFIPLDPLDPDEPLVPEVVPTAIPICFMLVIIEGAAGIVPVAATAVTCTWSLSASK
jgi:hypothetical protein